MRENALAACLCLLVFSLIVQSQETYFVQRCILTVYRDGVVHVYIEASVNENEVQITLPLFSSPKKIVYGPIVLDEDNEPLYYDINEENNTIVVYSLGAKQVKLEYDTVGLTAMEYGLWTLKVSSPLNLILVLPKSARIIYLSDVPSKIETAGDQIELSLYPGEWEISYEITAEPEKPVERPPSYPNLLTYLAIGGACAACAAILTAVAIYIRRKRISRELSEEELEVIKFIRSRGGRALEAELRERFPHIPRTSMWRLIRRLERHGIVQVKKVGLQNVVELK